MESFELKCSNGILKVYDDRVIISRKTITGFITQGLKGEKVFFYNNLASVEYKKPTFFANGYMKFITAGTEETNQNIGFLGTTTVEAAKDPNTVILRAFNKEIPEKSEQIYNYIMKQMKVNRKNGSIISSSNADEIRKYKKLLDDKIITQEEFEQKKRELLK